MHTRLRAALALSVVSLSLPVTAMAQKSGGGGVIVDPPATKHVKSESADPSFFDRLFAPKPAPVKRATCGDKPTIKERVACRLTTDEAALAYESATAYMPEECRASATGKDACVKRYLAFQPCWKLPVGSERTACARKVIGLGLDLKVLVKDCAAKPVKDRQACKDALRDKVFTLVKFRIYDLAERAEAYVGVERFKAATILFVTNAELAKQTFNKALNDTQRAKVVESMRLNWRAYAKLTGDADTTAKGMVEAQADLKAVR